MYIPFIHVLIIVLVKSKPLPHVADNESSECDTEDEIERYAIMCVCVCKNVSAMYS